MSRDYLQLVCSCFPPAGHGSRACRDPDVSLSPTLWLRHQPSKNITLLSNYPSTLRATPTPGMVTDAGARPKKGSAKRKGNQKSLRERRDIDIMNVRPSTTLTTATFFHSHGTDVAPDK